jgi:Zn-dependent protease/CBS domain-containing protein
MFTRRFDLFTLFGIPIRIDLSWFVIAALVSWSLAGTVFPDALPGLEPGTYWMMGLAAALGLFASIVIHELAHAVVAQRQGLPIRGITLFIFGGVAEMESEPPSPKAEFLVAIAGPLASLALGIMLIGGTAAALTFSWPAPLTEVVKWLGLINVILIVFNMIPAFPLDGGRVLRSALWSWKDNLRWATRVTSQIGSGFGVLLIGFGLWSALFQGDLIGGLWMVLIGMFLRNAAQLGYRQLVLRRVLEGEPVSRFMQTNPVTVPRSISVAELVESYIYRHHFKLFPVVDGERLVGCVTTRQVKELPREEWDRQTVGALCHQCSPENTVAPDSDAMEALARMSGSGSSRLMVVEGGRLVGIIALKDLLRFLSLKIELEGERA